MANTFVADKDRGRTGELYALKHINELIIPEVVDVQDTAVENITGKDCVAILADGSKLNAEIKTTWNFLWRTDDDEEPHGTLEFELWGSESRKTAGWLPKMVCPEKYKPSVRPDVLVFLLVAYQNAFASIAFENVNTLIDALVHLATEDGIDLTDIPCGDEALKLKSPYIKGNVWLVPFSMLEKYATVTLIGDKPRERPDIVSGEDGVRRCPRYCQHTRYKFLEQCAAARERIPVDAEFVRAFTGDKLDDVIAIIDHDLHLLEKADLKNSRSCLAQLNKRAAIFNSLQAVLLNMLAHENASRDKDKARYYPISYSFIQDWEARRGHSKAIKTWFNHIKILLILGLIEYFRPQDKEKNAVDAMVNKNNDKPDCVGYYRPVLFTRELNMEADYQAQEMLTSGMRLSEISKKKLIREEFDFEKIDNDFGNDGRKIARANDYVLETYLQTMFDMVYDKGYVLPEEVANKVKAKIKAEKRLWRIAGEFEKYSEQNKKEWMRQKPYWDEFNELTEDPGYLAKKLYFEYGPLRDIDQVWLGKRRGISIGQWVIKPATTPFWADELILDYKIKKKEKQNAARRKQRKK